MNKLNDKKTIIAGTSLPQLQELLVQSGLEKFRAKQILQWIYERGITDFEQMTNLPKQHRGKFAQLFSVLGFECRKSEVSAIDGTEKALLCAEDGICIECVLLPKEYGNSVCVSSQAGCRMGCIICATASCGFERNLTYQEMAGQVLYFDSRLKQQGQRVDSVVVMGMGEPLDNFENLVLFLRALTDENQFNIRQRGLTVSTCGLVPQIAKLAELDLQITLAISLHAADDEKRSQIIPVNRKYPIAEVLKAADAYSAATKRRMTYEYALIRDFNDTDDDAKKLIALLKGRLCHLNIIPYNSTDNEEFRKPGKEKTRHFAELLKEAGIGVTIRKEMGSDISGACGQLKLREG